MRDLGWVPPEPRRFSKRKLKNLFLSLFLILAGVAAFEFVLPLVWEGQRSRETLDFENAVKVLSDPTENTSKRKVLLEEFSH